MADSKIQIKIGQIEFSGEGNQDWLSIQLDKILEKVPELLSLKNSTATERSKNGADGAGTGKPTNLPAFLKEKDAMTNQTRKFLAAAAFIQLGGKDRIMTSDVSGLLSKTNQTKINNPSDTLNKNVTKGHCLKEGNSFYVTPEGFIELSIQTD